MAEGLLSLLLKQSLQGNLLGTLPPKLDIVDKEIVIRITEQEFFEIATKDLPPNQKSIVRIELHEGHMIIKVRLV